MGKIMWVMGLLAMSAAARAGDVPLTGNLNMGSALVADVKDNGAIGAVCVQIAERYEKFVKQCGSPFECRAMRGGEGCKDKMAQYELCRKELAKEQDDLVRLCNTRDRQRSSR